MAKVAESVLKRVEREYEGGISSADLLAFLADQQVHFGEATLRKWVQLGLLPRSVRVGTKGKHQGSKGLYPVRVVRQILRIKEMMAQNLTIEEIKDQFLFVRGEVEELEQTLETIFEALERVAEARGGIAARAVSADLSRAQGIAKDLVERLERIERRLVRQPEADSSEVAAS